MTGKKPTRPVDIYVRVSRTKGRDVEAEGGTAEQQETRCRQSLASKGYRAGKVFTDLDESGGKTSRPAFDQLLARVRAGKSGGLVALNMSRFGRNRNVAGEILDLVGSGAEVMFVEDNIDTSTASGKLMLDIIAAFNTYYLENLRQQQYRNLSRMVEAKVHGGSTPAGYRRNGGRQLVPDGDPSDPATPAGKVRHAFELKAAGATWEIVADALSGIPTSKTGSTVWSKAAARGVLLNPVYTGQARSGKAVLEGAHEPLVDRALFHRVARTFKGGPGGGRGRKGGRPLSRVMKCGTCGGGMTSHGDNRGHRFYTCCSPKGKCSHRVTIMQDAAEDYVFDLVFDRLGVVKREALEGGDADTAALDAQVEAAHAAYTDACDLLGVDELPAEAKQSVALRDAEAARQDAILAGARTVVKYADFADDPAAQEAFRSLPVEQQRAVVADLAEDITVRPGRGKVEDRIAIAWREAA